MSILPPQTIALTIALRIDQLSPRGVRQHFIYSLKIAIARLRVTREIDAAVCEELWRSLPPARGLRV
jgi:hypothetical protein